ncbi:MAG TPA: amidase [Baekduia sp.]|uniref:amidase n=1 Tax=Baekduia sp. TaxID=2600305 RepID=UPI002B7EDDD0|nr:amidase [Baekduia sp.]HMJ37367.1 amidase [Baekduia sp.]
MTAHPAPPESAGLAFAGLLRQAEAVASGEVSSVELVDAALARIEAAQPELNAFRCVRTEAARVEAGAADRRRAAGERAPLLGVPVAIKDDMDLTGETTAFGCSGAFAGKEADGEVARRLRAAGAVIVGKTTSPELGQWPITEGEAFGVTRNPWSLDHTPGGSSGGSAAAVAAGLVPAAMGSDGAGSVRIPAAWTHLVGIKPQRGRISTWPDPESFNGLTCCGPLARTVQDAALLLDAVAGPHPGDRHTPAAPATPFAAAAQRDPGRLRIALSFKIPFSGAPATLDPEVRAAVERVASVLEGLGHEIVDADPTYGLIGATFIPRSMAGLTDWATRVPDAALLDERTRHNAKLGRFVGGPLLALARALERPLQAQVGRVFRRADVVLAPTTAQPPLPVGAIDGLGGWATDKVIVGACPYAWPWNVLGWPGVNVPAGLTGSGLPIGAQLLGPAESEPQLVALAAQLEAVERWADRRPPYPAAA